MLPRLSLLSIRREDTSIIDCHLECCVRVLYIISLYSHSARGIAACREPQLYYVTSVELHVRMYVCTVEPLNNGHIGVDHFSIIEKLSSFRGKIYFIWRHPLFRVSS